MPFQRRLYEGRVVRLPDLYSTALPSIPLLWTTVDVHFRVRTRLSQTQRLRLKGVVIPADFNVLSPILSTSRSTRALAVVGPWLLRCFQETTQQSLIASHHSHPNFRKMSHLAPDGPCASQTMFSGSDTRYCRSGRDTSNE